MGIKLTTIKRLFAVSGNKCSMPQCEAKIVDSDVVTGNICHIYARRKGGPRYNKELAPDAKDSYENLLLLCRTCHTIVDANEARYPAHFLQEIKRNQDQAQTVEISPSSVKQAELLYNYVTPHKPKASNHVNSANGSVSIAVIGDNHGIITVSNHNNARSGKPKFPINSIGANAVLCGYIDYLFAKAVEYWHGRMEPGRLGKKIKVAFRLKLRTRNHLPVERFDDLVEYIEQLIWTSPAGKRHLANRTKAFASFEEYRTTKSTE